MSSNNARLLSAPWAWPALIATFAFILAGVAVDPAGVYPAAPQGPGLTIDEMFNVQEGVRLVEGLKAWVIGFVSWREVFGDHRDLPPGSRLGMHNPDHPPLGRLWLGLWHQLVGWIAPPTDHPGPFITACARYGSVAAFALTVFLCGWTAARWYGSPAGAAASLALLLMPRAFGHAHLAALESCMGFTYLAAMVSAERLWRDGRPATTWVAALSGVVWGAALLTKVQGILLVVPVSIWLLYQGRIRAIRPLVIWGLAGLITFFLFWPWLWIDPIHRFAEYLGRTTQRITIYAYYFGERFADRDVPWHYPWVLFLTTVPIGLQVMGLVGSFRAWREPRSQLILAAMLFPLILFSVPGVAVYDGERLFLVCFPLWAILIGKGCASAWRWLGERTSRPAAIIVASLFVSAQAWGLFAYWPTWLGYWNLAVGGARGAERLGMEIDYWSVGVTRELLEGIAREVPEGARIDVAPVLHQFQLEELLRQSPILRKHKLRLTPYTGKQDVAEYLLIFRRLADLPPELREWRGKPPLLESRTNGVAFAAFYDRRKS